MFFSNHLGKGGSNGKNLFKDRKGKAFTSNKKIG
jgi:hypothetical protein